MKSSRMEMPPRALNFMFCVAEVGWLVGGVSLQGNYLVARR